MRARAALAELLRSSAEWRGFFVSCCEAGALRLRYQARQFRDELRAARPDEALPLRDVEDALMAAARKALPRSPAASWDTDWAGELCVDAMARLAERTAEIPAQEIPDLDLASLGAWADRMHAASVANDPAAFRRALARWELAALAGLEGLLGNPDEAGEESETRESGAA